VHVYLSDFKQDFHTTRLLEQWRVTTTFGVLVVSFVQAIAAFQQTCICIFRVSLWRPTDQTTHQPTNQPTERPTNQPTKKITMGGVLRKRKTLSLA